MQRLDFRAMGCQMTAVLDTDRGTNHLDLVSGWFEVWEQALSRFRPDSELSRLNQRTGQWVCVSPILWEVLKLAINAAQWTGGLISPTILNALEAAGYDRSFEQIQADGPSAPSQPDGHWEFIKRQSSTRSIWLPPDARIDLGGVAKGWAAERAARKLGVHGPALMDAGGDVAVSGPRADRSPWPIGISDPFRPHQIIGTLKIARGGVATSGRDYRRWQKNGVWQHHLIDPRTGRPAQTDVLSVTVIAPSVVEAEIAAKAVLLSGTEAGLEWLETWPEFAALVMQEDGRLVGSTQFENYLWK